MPCFQRVIPPNELAALCKNRCVERLARIQRTVRHGAFVGILTLNMIIFHLLFPLERFDHLTIGSAKFFQQFFFDRENNRLLLGSVAALGY